MTLVLKERPKHSSSLEENKLVTRTIRLTSGGGVEDGLWWCEGNAVESLLW